MRLLALLACAGLLTGCAARDCVYGIAHRDCAAEGGAASLFPQDDARCRSYGLRPGTRAYAQCRGEKARVHALTRQESDDGFLRNPILPPLR